MSFARRTSTFIVACCLAMVGLGLSSPADALPFEAGATQAGADAQRVGQLIDHLRIEAAVDALQRQIGSYVQAVIAEEVARQRAAVVVPRATGGNGGGPLTDAQLHALAVCESGNTNGWRTGYFGLEDGTGTVGQRSWDSQVAQVQQIYRDHGRSAWGCADKAGLP